MTRFILRRGVLSLLVIVGVTFVTFAMILLVPGDPALTAAGRLATPDQIEATRIRLGLDEPIPVQYLIYLTNLLQGDLGTSVLSHRPVLADLLDVLPASLELVLAALILNVFIAFPLGVLAAVREGSRIDGATRLGVIASAGLPVFWLALMLQLAFAVHWPVLPLSGQATFGLDVGDRITGLLVIDTLIQGKWGAAVDVTRHLALPAVALAAAYVATITRITRSTMLGVLSQDYITLARAKGLSEFRVITRHALRNALIPSVTILGLQLGWMIGAVVLVEGIFGRRGVGNYAVTAIIERDIWAVIGAVLVVSVIFVVANLAVDVAYSWLNPKLRHPSR